MFQTLLTQSANPKNAKKKKKKAEKAMATDAPGETAEAKPAAE
jgi:hypothetical protein